MATVADDTDATRWARASVAYSSWSSSTTSETRPKFRASSAARKSPVSSIRIAVFAGTERDSATIGVEQNRPILTPGVANLAEAAATARSQLATSWHPAAVRSEEHTSELQSRFDLVCRLLLEKKKKHSNDGPPQT